MGNYLNPRQIRVLHVDDEPADLEITRILLKRDGGKEFEITSVISAEEGLEKLAKEQFDAIIADYRMPKMDGLEFLEEVRRTVDGVPFVLFSGKAEPEILKEALKKGADRCIMKNGNPATQCNELARAIRKLVKAKRCSCMTNEETRIPLLGREGHIITLFDTDLHRLH